MGIWEDFWARRKPLPGPQPRPAPAPPKPPVPPPVPPSPTPTPVPPQPQPPVPANDTDLVVETVMAHSTFRSQHGMNPLNANSFLMKSAQLHADTMNHEGKEEHDGLSDGTPWYTRLSAAGYQYSTAGENIAIAYSVGMVMQEWINSPHHLANILGNFTEIGVGKSGNYWCCDFGRPKGS